jgi:pyruvate oxidase
MDPLTNAVLGVLFLVAGVVATTTMYRLRGRSAVKAKRKPEPRAKPHEVRKPRKPPARSPAKPSRIVRTAPPPTTATAATPPTRATVPPVRDGRGEPPAEPEKTEKSERKWYKVAQPDEPAEGTVMGVEAGTRTIALSRVGGQYGAIDGRCPHQGGPLSDGTLEDGLLRCPWHGWAFDLRTGESAEPHHAGVRAYDVEVRDDGIYVAVKEAVRTAPTVSDVMVQTMVNWGVRHVFGMVGHSNLGVAEAMRKQEAKGNLTYFGIRHEGAASFACSAYAKLSGRPAACLAIAGPGATNLLTGLWDARMDRAPVLALTGQVNTQVLGPGTFQEIDQASAFKAVAAWSQTVLSTSNHAELMTLALKHAVVERGVAHLIFPDEVQRLPAPEATASGPEGRLGDLAITPAAESVDRAVALIAESRRPAVIVGYGARDSMPEVVALANDLGAPVLTTFKGKGQIPDDHPLAAGVLGRSGTPIASSMMSQADLLIVFGASFSDHTGIDRTKRIIQVDYDRLTLGKFHSVTVPVWGEIAITADLFRQRLPADLPGVDLRAELAERWSAWRAEKEKRAARDRGQGVASAAIFAALGRQAPPNAVIAVDVGNNTYSFGRYFECKRQSVLMSGYLGSIGFALPAAMGAWAAAPERPILSVSGDGGFGQYMGEFTTAVKYDMNLTHVLLNNNELGKISKEQREGRWPVWQTSLKNPNFAEYARLCGGHGTRVTEAEQLDEALAAAIAYEGPALVEIMSDTELT